MSVRPVKAGDTQPTATLADDIEAAGADTVYTWRYTRLDEARMLRFWNQCRGFAAAHWGKPTGSHNNCFRFCDIVLAAGQGVAVEPVSPLSLTARARAAQRAATLASNYSVLSANADGYLKVGLW